MCARYLWRAEINIQTLERGAVVHEDYFKLFDSSRTHEHLLLSLTATDMSYRKVKCHLFISVYENADLLTPNYRTKAYAYCCYCN